MRADDFDDRLQARLSRLLRNRRDHAQNFARTERHLHAATDVHLARQLSRDGVIELLAEGDFEADTGNHRKRGLRGEGRESSRVLARRIQSRVMRRSSSSSFFRKASYSASVASRGTRMAGAVVISQRQNGSGI